MSTLPPEQLLVAVEDFLDALHRQQVRKAKETAHLIQPGLTDEDLLNPDNFNSVMSDPRFVYEDGIAAGILSAKMAVRSRLIELLSPEESL